jgi:hypothetical protein
MAQELAQASASAAKSTTRIDIFVEVSKTDQRKVEFNRDTVTGQEIKTAANIALGSDLALRGPGGKLVLVTNDEEITIRSGEHFVALPPGTIS